MTKLVQIVLWFFAIQWLQTHGTPLFQGFSFKRSFDISLKPFEFKPISFIKEKWSPFGVFGRRHGIQKRNLDTIQLENIQGAELQPNLKNRPLSGYSTNVRDIPLRVPIPVASEVKVPSGPVSLGPGYVKRVPPVFEATDTHIPLYTAPPIGRLPVNVPNNGPAITLQPKVGPAVFTDQIVPIQNTQPIAPVVAKPLPSVPLLAPPEVRPALSPVVQPSIPPSVVPGSVPLPIQPTPLAVLPPAIPSLPSISTNMVLNNATPLPDITQNIITPLEVPGEVAPPIETNSITENPKKQNDSPFLRGSKIALQFGNMFLQLMTQFFSNARASLDLLSNPPPVFKN